MFFILVQWNFETSILMLVWVFKSPALAPHSGTQSYLPSARVLPVGTWRAFYIQNAFFQTWWLDVERFVLLNFPWIFPSHLLEHSPKCVALHDK